MTVEPDGQPPIEKKREIPEDQTANLDPSFERSVPAAAISANKSQTSRQSAKLPTSADQNIRGRETRIQSESDGLDPDDEQSLSVRQNDMSVATHQGTSTPDDVQLVEGSAADTEDNSSERSRYVGRYLVRHLLGQGAFGRVYEAHDPQLDRPVAIKVSKEVMGPDAINRFLREARSAAHLRHPNIIPVFEYGQVDDLSMIVYELVDGETLRSYIKRNSPLPIAETISIIRKIADGLDYAHKQGIIHRDVKPDNILVDKQGEPHIADFGCARRFDDQDMHQTMEGSILGTPMYMSPEQASGGAHRADGRTDVWSLGVMLYEMISGEKPFQGKLSDLLHKIRHLDAKPLRKVQPATPRDIETICARCLRRELDQRFATAGELAAELERYQRGEPIQSRRISLVRRTWLWARRNRAVASLIAAVIALSLLGTTISTYFWIQAVLAQQARAKAALEQLVTANSEALDNVLTSMEESKDRILDSIRGRLSEPDLDAHQWRRLKLGEIHLEFQSGAARQDLFADGSIRNEMLAADGHELLAFCNALSAAEQLELIPSLWLTALDTGETNGRRLRAALALAQLDNTSSNWSETRIVTDAAGYLTAMDIIDVQQWLGAIEPIRDLIKPAIKDIFSLKRTLDDASPESAAVLLADMLADYDPDRDANGTISTSELESAEREQRFVVELVPAADARQLAHLMSALEMPRYRDQSIKLLTEQLKIRERPQAANEQLASEKANLVLALIRLEQPQAWQKLRRGRDNSVATEVIELLGPASTPVDLLLAKMNELLAKPNELSTNSDDADALATVLLSLGQFSFGQMPQTQREDIVADQVSHIFRTHGDARVHSSARWLMTKWGGKFEELAREIEQVELRRELPEPGKNWHVDLSGCTFAVFEPDEFEMGSGGELPHRRRIPRRFGICIQETTVGEFVMFVNALRVRAENRLEALANSSDERPIRVQEVEIKKLNRKLEEMAKLDIRRPITDVDFFKALAYCRWLSDKQNLRSSLPKIDQLEQFYEKGDGMAYSWVHLDRPGYRLPTAGEWEFACRARTDTLRPFGLIDRRLNQNAWFVSNSENSTQPVALLKPNVAGLFDMLGNVNEWCLDFYHSDLAPEWELSGESEPLVDFADQRQSPAREYRGGSYSSELNELQTAHRTGTNARKGFRHLGFRIARTYPPAD